MRGILKIRMLSVRAALLAALAVGLMLPGAQAQSTKQNQKSDNKASGSAKAQPSHESSESAEAESVPKEEHAGGPHEGIKVHGHWVIDVRNPDGKLVKHHEFENSYYGSVFLPTLLARQRSVGFWEISLDNGAAGDSFLLTEPEDTRTPDTYNFRTLNPPSGNLVLTISGTFTAPISDTITQVTTLVSSCSPNTAPATPCVVGSGFSYFTTASQSVSFASGQIVQVTVNISFL